MTLTLLRAAIKAEARVKVGTNLDAIIDGMIGDILRDYGNKARYREVLVIDQAVTLIAAQSTYALPADFQHMHGLRYSQDGRRFRPLYEFNEGQNRVSSTGWPRYYQLCAAGIMLFPYDDIIASNTLFLSYFKDPSTLFDTDADPFPIPRLEPAVKKMAIARVIRYMQQLDESNTVVQDAGASFTAAEGGQ